MTTLDLRPLAVVTRLAMVLAMAHSLPVHAQAGGTVLFAQDGTQIINASGQARAARQGDVLQAGERIQTPANGISQVKLSDGSLMGLRPAAELRIDARPPGSPVAPPEMTLLQGGVRVVGAELVDKTKSSALVLNTGSTSIQMKGADIESAVLKPAAGPAPAPGSEPGTYNRLATGSATLRSGAIVEPLPPRQISFVPANSPVPSILASVGPTVFASTRPRDERTAGSLPPATTGGQTAPAPPRVPAEGGGPVVSTMTSTLTAPRPAIVDGRLPVGPGPVSPLPVFSPISTGAVNPEVGSRPPASGAPVVGGGSTGVIAVRPPPPPLPPPVAILLPPPKPLICVIRSDGTRICT